MSALVYDELLSEEQAARNAPPDERIDGPWRVAALDAKLAQARERMRQWGIAPLDASGKWPERRARR